MNKRASFILLIAFLHLLFVIAAAAGHFPLLDGTAALTPLAKMLLCPLYPLWNHSALPSVLVGPLLTANSLLWGVMAERLVWGRKNIWVRRAKKQ